jgi:DNA-binding transcriptional ArsR family regulator
MSPAARRTNLPGLAVDLAAFDKLEPVIHTKTRLAIVSLLAATESLAFTELRDNLRLTDGNLAAHLRALDSAGFVQLRKASGSGKPVTKIALTKTGRTSFTRYLEALEHIVKRHR